MTSLTYALNDSATMLRRNLKRMLRYPSMTVFLVGMPVVFLLLFVYVLGGTLGTGLGGAGRADYVKYVSPGILIMTITGAATATAVGVAQDMTEGIIARFRTMAIYRPSVLAGHVIGNVIQTMVSLIVVLAVAVLVGFRPTATPVEWLAAAGILVLIALALTWLSVAMGLAAKTVESASNMPTPLFLLPFFGSGFVPTDSMPTGLRLFAEYQPFTPMIETLRGLLTGTGIGNNGWMAAGWCIVIAVAGYLWSVQLFKREPGAK